MIRNLPFVAVLAAAAFGLSATSAFAEVLKPTELTNTDCKNRYEAPAIQTRSDYDDDYFEEDDDPESSWTVSYKDGRLTVIWHDMIANCCPEGFESNINLEGNTIIFDAHETEGWCDCLCPYDITTTYEGVAPGHYTISFRQYSYEYMTAEVDLSEGSLKLINRTETSVKEVADGNFALDVEGSTVKARCEGDFRIDVFGASGMKVYSAQGSDNSELSLAGLASGVYYVRLTSAKGGVLTRSARF